MSGWRSLFSWLGSSHSPPPEDSRQKKYETKLEQKYGLQSGKCSRPDGEVVSGWASMRGKRPLNEDTVYCQWHNEQGVDVGAFGVFDGHGGPSASRFVRDRLFKNLLAHEQFARNLGKAVEDAYVETDEQYCELDSRQQRDDGTTAVTAVLVGKRLVVAHCGDSRAVLSCGASTLQLSADHKPARDDERGRIESAGGAVVWAGTWRVGGVLAVSRSFGNRMLKQFIIPHPEICDLLLNERHACLVLASDGLWDAVSNQEAVRLALEHRAEGPEAAARALASEAFVRGSCDNISCVVVFFDFSS